LKVDDLNIDELLDFASGSGLIRFAGQRAVLMNASALGQLRRELIEKIGITAARAILTRFGFVHGWRMAELMKAQFNWETTEDWVHAGGRIHMIEGMYRLDDAPAGALSKEGLALLESYEAEEHLSHLGRSDIPVCWTITGLLSGYLSRAMDQQIYVLEEHCTARGDTACQLFGRTREEWGDERSHELRFFHTEDLRDLLDESLHRVTETLQEAEHKLRDKNRMLARVTRDPEDPAGMVARSPAMRRLLDIARRIARVDSTVLVTGESGTGKERVARLVHETSARARGPFIAVNCGAITETLLESELFGHARGAFTGATQDRPGLFESANKGTILLDEIGEVPIGMQVKLLRVLQEREIRRVGENKSRPIDVRVIAATNRELTEDIAKGRFRQDLYYRLNVVELHVPPLRDRREDILPLARQLLAQATIRLKRPIEGLSPRAADQLLRYSWPGNVRELENAMERAVALARMDRTDFDDLPEEVRQAVAIPVLEGAIKMLDQVEKEYILAVLALNSGNQTRTAEQLGIGSATLYRKLKKFGAPGSSGDAGDGGKPLAIEGS